MTREHIACPIWIILMTALAACSSDNRKPIVVTEQDARTGGIDHGTTDVALNDASEGDMGPSSPLTISPNRLEFTVTEVGVQQLLDFTVTNVGTRDVTITQMSLVEPEVVAGAEFEAWDWPTEPAFDIQPSQVMEFSVAYAPRDESFDDARVELKWSDEDGDGELVLPLVAGSGAPSVVVTPEVVLFGGVEPVDDSTRDSHWLLVEIRNDGAADLQLDDIVVAPGDSDFTASFPSGADTLPIDDAETFEPTSLPPGGVYFVRLMFNPLDDLPSAAELIVFTNDPNRPELAIRIQGNT